MSESPTAFKDAYRLLQRHANTLREAQEPNIDELLTLVQESVAAYQICQARIDAVEKALEATFNATALPTSPPPNSPD